MLSLPHVLMLVAARSCTALVLNTLKSATVLNPATGTPTPLLDGLVTSRNVVVLLPQVDDALDALDQRRHGRVPVRRLRPDLAGKTFDAISGRATFSKKLRSLFLFVL